MSVFVLLCATQQHAYAAQARTFKKCRVVLGAKAEVDPETLLGRKVKRSSTYDEAIRVLRSKSAAPRVTEDEIFEMQHIWDSKKKKFKDNPDFVHPPSFASNTVAPLTFGQFIAILKVLRPYRYEDAEAFVRKKTARWSEKTSLKPERFPAVHLVFGVRMNAESIYNVELMLVDANKGANHRNLIEALGEAMDFAIKDASGATIVDRKDLLRFTTKHAYFDVDSGHTIVVIAKESGSSSVEYFTTGDFDIRRSLESYGHQGRSIEDWADDAAANLESIPLRR